MHAVYAVCLTVVSYGLTIRSPPADTSTFTHFKFRKFIKPCRIYGTAVNHTTRLVIEA